MGVDFKPGDLVMVERFFSKFGTVLEYEEAYGDYVLILVDGELSERPDGAWYIQCKRLRLATNLEKLIYG